MSGGRPGVSVVVCAYTERRWQDLHDALTQVRAQLRPGDEAVVVIDHNDELLARAVRAHPWARVMSNDGRRGLSGARNTAIAASTREVVVFLDDDAVPQPGWLEDLVQPLGEGGTLVTGGAAEPRFPGPRPAFLPHELDWVVGCTYAGQPTEPGPVRNVMGCSMAFRREVFDAVGTFAEDVGRIGAVPLGCEETELCIRVGQHFGPGRIRCVPSSLVRHTVDPARTRWRYLVDRGWAEGRSKAHISSLVGAGDSTSIERTYLGRTIPRGLARELGRLARGHLDGARGALGIVLTVVVVVAGYAWGLTAGALGRAVTRRA